MDPQEILDGLDKLTQEFNALLYSVAIAAATTTPTVAKATGVQWNKPLKAQTWKQEIATEKQRNFLRKLGVVNLPAALTKGEAGELIAKAKNEKGLS